MGKVSQEYLDDLECCRECLRKTVKEVECIYYMKDKGVGVCPACYTIGPFNEACDYCEEHEPEPNKRGIYELMDGFFDEDEGICMHCNKSGPTNMICDSCTICFYGRIPQSLSPKLSCEKSKLV